MKSELRLALDVFAEPAQPKPWPSRISRVRAEGDDVRGNSDDRSVSAFAVKRRAFAAPLCCIGA